MQAKLHVMPFTVTVVRGNRTYKFDVRGTHDTLYRLCQRIDDGQGRWGREFGPMYYDHNMPRNGEPTEYDDRYTAYQANVRMTYA